MTAEQVINGIIAYADNEVMIKLPTTGKWLLGTGIALATNKITDIIVNLQNNSMAKLIGIVDENGEIDVDALILAMKTASDRYGEMTIDVPLIGKMTFSSIDIDHLRSYM